MIRGFAINRFSGDGIFVNSSSWQIQSNYVGIDTTGKMAEPNGVYGVQIVGSGNTIGGLATTPGTGSGNVVSGNGNHGIDISSNAANNLVEGNIVGLQADGSSSIANSNGGVGVSLFGTGPGNTIGGTAAGAANVISGNAGDGVILAGANGDVVEGNLIGTDASGTLNRGNASYGIRILGSTGNTIGGSTAAARNIISANDISGVLIENAVAFFGLTGAATNNQVEGNFIGTDKTGTSRLGNSDYGVDIEYDPSRDATQPTSTSGNTIGGLTGTPGTGLGNIISGNSTHGVGIGGGATANVVAGNLIGLGLKSGGSGAAPLPNTHQGVELFGAGAANVIGGTVSGASNVISGNGNIGIELAGVTGELVAGDLIGTDPAGATTGFGNGADGVNIIGSSGNTIGGSGIGARNIISGNASDGLVVVVDISSGMSVASNDNLIAGNYVGTDVHGEMAIANALRGVFIEGNASGNTVGGIAGSPGTGLGNLISGNTRRGVAINTANGAGPTDNTVAGNLIGLDALGTTAIPNVLGGVVLIQAGSGNVIGGSPAGAGNVISGNTTLGMEIVTTSGTLMAGNDFGMNVAGTTAVPNSGENILLATAAS